MNPIAKDALKRATIARMAMTPDPVAVLTPMAQRVQAIQVKSKSAPAPAPVPAPPAPVAAAKPKPVRKTARKSSREADKFVVRLPDGMRSQITDVAQADERSMNKGAVIYRGEARKQKPSHYVPDADDIVSHMFERASDDSEHADSFPDVTKEQEEQLEILLEPIRAWADRYCDVKFYEVVDIQPYTVTAEDVAAAAAYREQRDHFETPAAVAKQIYDQQELKALPQSGQVEPAHGLSVRPSESSKPGEQA